MALTNASLPAKRRILAVCVKLFLEQGYKKTTVAEIVQKADVSNSSFQNIFRAKDGVLTELNENLREIYIEAYTHEEAAEYIHRQTARELHRIFGTYQPELTVEDFYACELGSAGLMRGYMARECDRYFPLEKKLDVFLTMSLRGYKVPEEEIGQVRAFISGMDIRAISQQVMETLFQALAMRYAFVLDKDALQQK